PWKITLVQFGISSITTTHHYLFSTTKQRFIWAVALSKVLSKFLMRILHLSIQEFERSMTHLALTGTNPDCP
ncbi:MULTISPECIES: hypothetical protein, partial [unclassified Microcoleus]|uniref:hypothetical protein n=1 Tax=unclassified Microcoleus TaxID=2642155 RepID=UPI002FCF948A